VQHAGSVGAVVVVFAVGHDTLGVHACAESKIPSSLMHTTRTISAARTLSPMHSFFVRGTPYLPALNLAASWWPLVVLPSE
jgi:hypothetical protein